MKGVFCFKVKGSGGKEGVWVVDAKNGNGSVKFGVDREYLYQTGSLMEFVCWSLSIFLC